MLGDNPLDVEFLFQELMVVKFYNSLKLTIPHNRLGKDPLNLYSLA